MAPPLNATTPPNRDGVANRELGREARPLRETAKMTMWSRAIPAASTSATSDTSTDNADDRYGSFFAMSDMKLYGYQVRFAAAGAR